MRKTRYVVYIVFVCIALVYAGELFTLDMYKFIYEFSSTQIEKPDDISWNETLSDIENTATKNDCLVFAILSDTESHHNSHEIIYAMDGAEDIIIKTAQAEEGDYFSFRYGSVGFYIEPLSTMPESSRFFGFYRVIGDYDDVLQFREELSDKYGENIPDKTSSYDTKTNQIIMVWSLLSFFFLLLTMFEVSILKKEMIVRFIYGDNLIKIIVKRIISDTIFYSSTLAILIVILKNVFNVQASYKIDITIIAITIFLFLNALIYLSLLFADYKKSLSFISGSKNILKASYIFKLCAFIAVSFLMAFFIDTGSTALDYIKQKDYFEELQDYSYVRVNFEEDKRAEMTQEAWDKLSDDQFFAYDEILNDVNKSGNARISTVMYSENENINGKATLLYNASNVDYLKKQIPEISNYNFETNTIYYIIPEQGDNCEKILEEQNNLIFTEYLDFQTITYNSNVEIIGIGGYALEEVQNNLYDNPMIILDTRDEIYYKSSGFVNPKTPMIITDEQWNRYMDEYEVSDEFSYSTNVYESYMFYYNNNLIVLLFAVAALLVLLIVNVIIIKTLLRYEYIVNAIELSVRTVMGESIITKYKKLFLVSGITIIFGLTASLIITQLMGTISTNYVLSAYLITSITDIIIMLFYIKKFEKHQVNKILKGGIF